MYPIYIYIYIYIYITIQTSYVFVPVLLVVLAGWDSGDVRLCLRPCSSDGEVGSDETGGV